MCISRVAAIFSQDAPPHQSSLAHKKAPDLRNIHQNLSLEFFFFQTITRKEQSILFLVMEEILVAISPREKSTYNKRD